MKKTVENCYVPSSLPTAEEGTTFFSPSYGEGVTRGPDFLMYKPVRKTTTYSNIPRQINVSDIVEYQGMLWEVFNSGEMWLNLKSGLNVAYLVSISSVRVVQQR